MAPKGNVERASTSRRLSGYRITIIAGVVVAVGVALLFIGAGLDWFEGHATTKAVLDQLGGILVTTGGLGILWDLRGRRDLIDEVLARVDVGNDVELAGIRRVSMDWKVVPWAELIAKSRNIDVFIAYGSTWLSNYSVELAEFAKRPRNKLRYFLPDPEDNLTTAVLAERFDYTTEVLQGKIIEAAKTVAKISRDGNADVRVWFRSGAPTFTCYRFDNQIVVTLYSHKLGKGAVPTMMLTEGAFANFSNEDLDDIEKQSREVGRNELLGEI